MMLQSTEDVAEETFQHCRESDTESVCMGTGSSSS